MRRAVPVQKVIEQFQQILECGGTCLVLGCSDADLRHPLLDALPAPGSSPLAYRSGLFTEALQQNLAHHERVQALCDLAIQSGRMQTLHDESVRNWRIQSLAVVPLERPAGVLGVLLLADKQAKRFGRGEERLLHTCLLMYTKHLESSLWEQVFRPGRDDLSQTKTGGEPEQLIKSEFVSMVGHELRAPLSIIKGYTGLLQVYGSAASPEEQELTPAHEQHCLDVIMEQTGLLELLVNDLLDISRLQQGKLTLHLGPIETGPLCQQIVQLGQLRAHQQAASKHQFVCKVAAHLPPILADIDRLRQVLLNIVENAIKYSPDGGCIELAAGLAGDQEITGGLQNPAQVYLSVRDQGVGIPASHIARLFHPFERLDRPAIARIPGSGLGLYIAQKLVEAMQGKILVRSEQDCGTIVTILLPTVDPRNLRASQGNNPSCAKSISLL